MASSNVIFILRSIGQNPSQADVQVQINWSYFMKLVIKLNFQDLVGQVDKDGTGSIDFPEFLQMMTLKYEEENAEDEIRTAFQVFDTVSENNENIFMLINNI